MRRWIAASRVLAKSHVRDHSITATGAFPLLWFTLL